MKVGLEWMDSEIFERDDAVSHLENVHGILVPGGFGERGTEGKIHAVKFARERKVPFFGICFGMQMAVIEAARNLLGIEDASSSEFGPTEHAVVGLMTEWIKGNQIEKRAANGDLGGTMRLGAYDREPAMDDATIHRDREIGDVGTPESPLDCDRLVGVNVHTNHVRGIRRRWRQAQRCARE